MPPEVALLILGVALLSVSPAAYCKLNCEEFSKGSTFLSSQALGTWYVMHLRPSSDPDSRCVQFSTIRDEERKSLQDKIGTYAKEIKWEKMALKMQIPCEGASGHNNKTRNYYLEELDSNGSYVTLLMPSPSAKLDSSSFDRHPMRLKLVEDKYLALMDCQEHFTFILDKQPHHKVLDPNMVKAIRSYLPEEHN